MTELASYWRECTAVIVRGEEMRRQLACGHIQSKPLEFLNDTTRKNPQAMVGKRFPCAECEKPLREKYAPKR